MLAHGCFYIVDRTAHQPLNTTTCCHCLTSAIPLSFLGTTATNLSSEYVLYLLPPIAALIGWLTNFLAVKMLFHPKAPISIFGFEVQGVFPKRQAQLAAKLGDLVSEELFSVEEVTDRIKEVSTSQETMDLIGRRIEKTIREKLVKSFPMLSMFLSDDMVEKVTKLFKDELRDFIRESADGVAKKIEKDLDVQEMVRKKWKLSLPKNWRLCSLPS